ncbi:MAG: ester cyclase [Actinobacteria bacterium]|nr:ester cyclase [Actinomycetota bacterium]
METTLTDNKETALGVSTAILEGDWERLDSLLDDGFTYTGDSAVYTKDEYIGFMQALKDAMSDMAMEFTHVLAEDDLVSIRFITTAKNTGKFMGAPASKKDVEITGVFIRRIEGGVVMEEWQSTDLLGLLTQMGFGTLFGYTIAAGLFKKQTPPARMSPELSEGRLADLRLVPGRDARWRKPMLRVGTHAAGISDQRNDDRTNATAHTISAGWRDYGVCTRRYITPGIGDVPLEALTPTDVKPFQTRVQEDNSPRRGRRPTPRTANLRHSTRRLAFAEPVTRLHTRHATFSDPKRVAASRTERTRIQRRDPGDQTPMRRNAKARKRIVPGPIIS